MNAPAKPFACTLCDRRYKTSGALADHQRDSHGVDKPEARHEPTPDPRCAECGEVSHLVTGERIYPHRPDLYHKRFWLCICGAYCGCHGVTSRALGFPAGPETRRARNVAHATFDPLWRTGRMNRHEAYAWLANAMQIDSAVCHIGMMSAEQAYQVASLVRALPTPAFPRVENVL
jgi:hypothetical protein